MQPVISKKKPIYPIKSFLETYLLAYGREYKLPLKYFDLKHFYISTPLYDKSGKDTLWESVQYAPHDMREIYPALVEIYALLKTEGDTSIMEHLRVERVDYCTFGNTKPFRIRIINNFNDNYDYFYVKIADASRIYGLELEHILSPNRINYITSGDTLIEEHIAGIPGDVFCTRYIKSGDINPIRLAKEFVKFNERCLVKLLGDMRAYNFVVDITPDFDDVQYRIRAIDFDQQSYEGKISLYQPHFFKENRPFVELGMKLLNVETMRQYQKEERTIMAIRIRSSREQLRDLFSSMQQDDLSPPIKTNSLREDLASYYRDHSFLSCLTSADILHRSLGHVLHEGENF